MTGLEQLNRLSCTRCKDRKVRCNRVMPRCSRCNTHDAECVYPQRVKRKSAREIAEQYIQSGPALATILNRLEQLEARSAAPSVAATPRATSYTPSVSTCSSPAAVVNTPSCVDSCDASHRVEIDATTILKDAVDQVQHLRLRSFSTSVITEVIDIPVDLAKCWIKNYFAHMPTWMFQSLIDKRTIELIPDILGVPHIHIEPVILVIYYCILFHGCSLRASNESSHASLAYSRSCYLACLRAVPCWQRQATGTMTDLIASLFMTRVAYQFFDEELSWKMFRHACEYCQALNLHKLDSSDVSWGNEEDKCDCDDDRKGFWEVLQIDLYFRLIMNKPPIISVNAWQVNLPWLDVNSQPPPHGIQATAFLASSRVTLVIIRFFALLENPENGTKADIMSKTEGLCREILDIFEEWQLDKWMANDTNRDVEIWEVADVLLTGYTAVVYMFRKMAVLDSTSPEPVTSKLDIPESVVVMDACRLIINLIGRLLVVIPYADTMITLFGAYRCYIAFSYIANAILRASDMRQHMEDIKSLERLGDEAELLCRGQRDMVPMIRAMQGLNGEIRARCMQLI
ncbi:hypothetical protein BGZ63DRAFT_410533 [Mariannaea sp. PMI_226]|nr:hypothetical protein BGZ63DRAFT_410533 [Mariannaea sp. PMI_226]